MKSKKKIALIFVFIVVALVVSIIYFHNDNKTDEGTLNSLENAEKDVSEFTKGIIETGMTEEEISDKVGQEVGSRNIMLGDDSYLNEKTTSRGINVDEWEQAQKTYSANVEAKIKEMFSYNCDETLKSDDGSTIVRVTIKSYYYFTYLDDLDELTRLLLIKSGYKEDTDFAGNQSEKSKAEQYKAKIKAMEIMDNYLDNYDNYYEYKTTEIITYPEQQSTNISYMQYLLDLIGYGYNIDFGSEKYLNERSQRINKYINESIELGVLDPNNPLKLK